MSVVFYSYESKCAIVVYILLMAVFIAVSAWCHGYVRGANLPQQQVLNLTPRVEVHELHLDIRGKPRSPFEGVE